MKEYKEFEELKGKVLTKVEVQDIDEIIFTTSNGEVYKLLHEQDDSEDVFIEDICGDLEDLVGQPLLLAEEVEYDQKNPDGVPVYKNQDSFTWTFYKLSTINGSVTIRWYGQSNGYYSETVCLCQIRG
jgi:hypothetical protein